MASISETAGIVNAAGMEVGMAKEAVKTAEEAINRAKRMLFELMGDESPARLQEYTGALDNASLKCDQLLRFLDGGMESGQAFIAQLYS
jgi:hypothetical protein